MVLLSTRRSALTHPTAVTHSQVVKISAHKDLIGEFDKLSSALTEGPTNWVPGPVGTETSKVTELSAETPFGRLSRYARVETGPPELRESEVIVPISWQSLEGEELFPTVYGELRLQRVADGRSQLELRGYYAPPGGIIGQAADAIVMNALAKATVEDFVQRVAGILARNALGIAVDEPVKAGHRTLDA